MTTIDLSGLWRYETDPEDTGVQREVYRRPLKETGFRLPGSACENRVGTAFDPAQHPFSAIIRAPRERFEYIGPLWLQREFVFPEEAAGQDVTLLLERVNMASDLWVDGKKAGRRIISLSAPHAYALPALAPGKHTLTLRLDNRELISNGDWASAYSIDTQGFWIGVAGRIELQCRPCWHIARVDVFPDETGAEVHLIAATDLHVPAVLAEGKATLYAVAPDGTQLPAVTVPVGLFTRRQRVVCRYDIADPAWWSEFSPALYTLHVSLEAEGHASCAECRFGMRTVRREGRRFLLNGRPLALRGTIDCAQFPLTGYPPTDRETWRTRMRTLKRCGLNNVRFHAWCPPEAAFEAADEVGMYLQIELPLWLNRDIGLPEVGDDPIHRPFYMQEAMRIVRQYGNHPSFLLFSCGNETMGDFELLDDVIRLLRATDARRLYTLISNFDHPVQPSEDYFSAFSTAGMPLRIQHMHDQVALATDVDFRKSVLATPAPIVTFEVGQYCFYPDVSVAADYTGAMEPCNFAWIDQAMREKGVRGRLPEYLKASGDLAVKLYKEDIEAALRTEELGGFQLLALSDYTGQSTATVGLLDVFLRGKGVCPPEAFRCFCDSVVPLFKARRIFTPDDALEADLALYDHGPEPIENPVYQVEITRNGAIFWQVRTTQTHLSIPLRSIDRSCCLKVKVTVNGHSNHWQVYVFAPDAAPAASILRTPEELAQAMQAGGRHIALASCFTDSAQGSFIPVFWSPVHFPSDKPCGMMIDASHPALRGFPTGVCPDYQWQALLDASRNLPIPQGSTVIMEAVPNYVDNTPRSPLYETRCGQADLLVCGFDIDADAPPARQLKASLCRYAAGARG